MLKWFADLITYGRLRLSPGDRLAGSLYLYLKRYVDSDPQRNYYWTSENGEGGRSHGYVPVEFVAKYAGNHNPFAVIIAVLIGVPLYSNAAATIPVVQALFSKGLALGTTLAFMMAVTALSLPEFIILRKVLKPRLLLTYFGTVAVGIIIIGYLFNFVF
jgi:hypothetical protein